MRLLSLPQADLEKDIAIRLGFAPFAPETWPMDIIARILAEMECEAAKIRDDRIRRLMGH